PQSEAGPQPQPQPQPQPAPEPMLASIFRRGLGWLVDYAVVMIPGAILVGLALVSLVHALPGYLGGVAAEVGVSHLIGLFTHHGAEPGELAVAASEEWTRLVRPLIGALVAVPLLQFLY